MYVCGCVFDGDSVEMGGLGCVRLYFSSYQEHSSRRDERQTAVMQRGDTDTDSLTHMDTHVHVVGERDIKTQCSQ